MLAKIYSELIFFESIVLAGRSMVLQFGVTWVGTSVSGRSRAEQEQDGQEAM